MVASRREILKWEFDGISEQLDALLATAFSREPVSVRKDKFGFKSILFTPARVQVFRRLHRDLSRLVAEREFEDEDREWVHPHMERAVEIRVHNRPWLRDGVVR
jgi:hypothetical protein